MILHYQIIPLKLPVCVAALLNLREGIAAETDKTRRETHRWMDHLIHIYSRWMNRQTNT